MRKICLLLAAAAALAVAGCGEVLDAAKTEDQLESILKKEQGVAVISAECPDDVDIESGETFTCTVNVKGLEPHTATLEIRNEDADVDVIDFSESSTEPDSDQGGDDADK